MMVPITKKSSKMDECLLAQLQSGLSHDTDNPQYPHTLAVNERRLEGPSILWSPLPELSVTILAYGFALLKKAFEANEIASVGEGVFELRSTRWKEKANSSKLSSDFCMCAVVVIHTRRHTHTDTHAHTHTRTHGRLFVHAHTLIKKCVIIKRKENFKRSRKGLVPEGEHKL